MLSNYLTNTLIVLKLAEYTLKREIGLDELKSKALKFDGIREFKA